MLYLPPHAEDGKLFSKATTQWSGRRHVTIQNRDNPRRGFRLWHSTLNNLWLINRYRITEGYVFPTEWLGFQPHATNAGALPLAVLVGSHVRYYNVRYTGTTQQYAQWTLTKPATNIVLCHYAVAGNGAVFNVTVNRGSGFGATEGTVDTGAEANVEGLGDVELAAPAPAGSIIRFTATIANTQNGRLCGCFAYDRNRVAVPGEPLWMAGPQVEIRKAAGAEDYVSLIGPKDTATLRWAGNGHQGGANCLQAVSLADQTSLIETAGTVTLDGVTKSWEGDLRGIHAGELVIERPSVVIHPDHPAEVVANYLERITYTTRGVRAYHRLTADPSQAAGVDCSSSYCLMHSVQSQHQDNTIRPPFLVRVGSMYMRPTVAVVGGSLVEWPVVWGPADARDLVWEVPTSMSYPWARLLWTTRPVVSAFGVSSGNTRKTYLDVNGTGRTLIPPGGVISESESEFWAAGGLTPTSRAMGIIDLGD